MRIRNRPVRPPPNIDEEALGVAAYRFVTSLREADYINTAIDRFVASYPHYATLKDFLQSECELACAASAMMASAIAAAKPLAATGIVENLKRFLKRGGRTAKSGKPVRVLEPEHCAKIRSYLESFAYVYDRTTCGYGKRPDFMSALSTVGYATAMHALAGDPTHKHNDINNVLHELVMPLLMSTFKCFLGE